MIRYILIILVVSVSVFMNGSVYACVGGIKCAPADAIDKAIESIEKESDDWQKFLRKAIDGLTDSTQSTVRNELNTTLINAIAAGGITAKCAGAFFKGSLIPELSSIKRAIFREEAVVRQPTFCLFSPNNIDYKLVKEGRVKIISMTGYNLFDPKFKVHILNDKNQKRDVTDSLSRTTHYQVSLNLGHGAIGSILTEHDKKVIISVNNQTVSEIPVIQTIPKLQRPNYNVTIYTGRIDKAGTDAAVYITLDGTNGDTKKQHLNIASHDDFEYGSVDTYTIVPTKDIGNITRVYIEHDNRRKKPGWFLDKIIVENTVSKKRWTFPCNRWLATSADDGKISRVLENGKCN